MALSTQLPTQEQSSDVPCDQNLSPKHEKGISRLRLGTVNFWEPCWSISQSFVLEHCKEAVRALTRLSAPVTHDFGAKVRQGDCSCWPWEDTPQGHCIPQSKCCLCEVLSWLYGRKTKGNYWGVQSCHSSCFCGLSCWQSHKKAVLGESCSQLLSERCQAPREECGHGKEPQKPSQPQLEGGSGTPWAHLPLHTAQPPNHLQQPPKHSQCQ